MGKYDGFTGQRIRNYRMMANLTQKELSKRCGISEPAIRNYELGNRLPDAETLKNIAYALEISPSILEEPNPTDVSGTMNILYCLEHMWGLHPVVENDSIKFEFGSRPSYAVPYITDEHIEELKRCIKTWESTRKQLIGSDFLNPNGVDVNILEYFIWTSKFPMDQNEAAAFRESHKEIYETDEYEPLYRQLIDSRKKE